MSDSYRSFDDSDCIETLKDSQIINAYTVFLALSKKKNVTSLKDFCDLRSDVAIELQNLKAFHEVDLT